MESTQDTELVVRPSRPEDRPGLLRLRREVYGDDVESGREAFFDWQYVRNPAGSGVVTIAEIDGEIVGELGALPTRFKLDQTETTAVMYVNFIVKPDLRGRGFGPAVDRVQRKQELDRDLWLMLGFVRLSNAPQLKVQTRKLGRVPFVAPAMLYRIIRPREVCRAAMGNSPLSRALGALAAGPVTLWNTARRPRAGRRGVEIKELRQADESLDRLWERVSRHYRYSVMKDRAFLSWRWFGDPRGCYRVLGAYRGGDLVGLTVTRTARWETLRLGVILEVLVEPSEREAADALVAAALDTIGDGVDMVSCMLQAGGAPIEALRRAGFVRIPSRLNPHEYILLGEALDGRMDLGPLVARESWHVSWGDFDVF